MSPTRLLPAAALLVGYACSDPSEPTQHQGINFLAPANRADTIDALFPAITVTIRDAAGQPMPRREVMFIGRNGRALHPATPIPGVTAGFSDSTDSSGRATAQFLLGEAADDAYLVVISGLFRDSLRFGVLPGALAGIGAVPIDTALAAGQSYEFRTQPVDRRGNRRPDILPSVVTRSLQPAVAGVQGNSVTALSTGRAWIELTAGAYRRAALVSVMPRGTLAVVDSALYVLDLEQHTVQLLAGVPAARCPSWHPQGDRLLLDGLRIVNVAGQVLQVPVTDSSLIPGCGVFSGSPSRGRAV